MVFLETKRSLLLGRVRSQSFALAHHPRRVSALPGSFPCSNRLSRNTPFWRSSCPSGPYWGQRRERTLTIVVRSLALGDRRQGVAKDAGQRVVNGCTTGFASAAWLDWYPGWIAGFILGVVVALAMLLNMIAAAAAGVLVPISLRFKDRSACLIIMVTTTTDIVGSSS